MRQPNFGGDDLKKLKYQLFTEDAPNVKKSFITKVIPLSERNMGIAQIESYNGEYEIIDDGEPEPEPTQLDRVEAQTTYTAMMTDTLLEV